MSLIATDPSRLLAATGVVALYAAACAAVALRQRRKRLAAQGDARALAQAGEGGRATLIVHASQTGNAERLAWQTAHALHGTGLPMRVVALGELTPADLALHATVLFIVSTTGEGDAPDTASIFVRRFMSPLAALANAAVGSKPLAGVQVGVLALGDRGYTHFCAFGRQLDAWLAGQGAQRLFERIEVDGLDATSLHRWQHELGRLASVGVDVGWKTETPQPWRLAARRRLNDGSPGAPVFHLELEPEGVALPHWEAGDLVHIHLGAGARPREYSIASVPAERRVHLLVRQERSTDGGLGLASGWLTQGADVDGPVALTILPHNNFRIGANVHRPLILIANGTGMAGVRSHLRARAGTGQAMRNWLIFGERQRAHDFHYAADIEAWQASGVIERLDLAFSRDQAAKVYVQDRLRAHADTLRIWLGDGAAIYVCGSLEGMATGVENVLVDIVGREGLGDLIAAGRYRRDVY